MSLAFIGNRLDRCTNRRGDAAWLAAQRQSPSVRMVHIHGDSTLITDGRLATGPADPSALTVFLGCDEAGAPWFACKSQSGEGFRGLRAIAMEALLPAAEIGILAQARSLIHWHEGRGFCSNCGGRNEVADGGYRRHCGACGADHFPRTDPVVIIVVRRHDGILLGRQASWASGMYSALAGFMEPGETIEDAARREVLEEAGIAVGTVRYVTSQPWPFPASLMIGLIGEATSDHIHLADKELEDARWFGREDVIAMVNRTHPQGLYAANPMAIAHHLVDVALQDS